MTLKGDGRDDMQWISSVGSSGTVCGRNAAAKDVGIRNSISLLLA
jgi:hypothetical protein